MDILLHATLSSDLSNTEAIRKSRTRANHSRRQTRSLFGAEITLETLTKTARLQHVLRRGYLSLPLRPLGIQARLRTVRSRHRPKRTVQRLLEQSSERSSQPSNKMHRVPSPRRLAGQDPHGLGSDGGLPPKNDCVHQREAEGERFRKAKVKLEVVDPPRSELTFAGRFTCFGILHGWMAQLGFIVIVSKSCSSFLVSFL